MGILGKYKGENLKDRQVVMKEHLVSCSNLKCSRGLVQSIRYFYFLPNLLKAATV